MTNTGDIPELDELEPLEAEPVTDESMEPAAMPPPSSGPSPVVMYAGLPTPFYNPLASVEYYRFLFAGVLITVGTMMPFGPEWQMAGYKTLSGGLFLIIGLGLIWSMWGAINIGRPSSMKWIGLAILPFLWGLFKVIGAWDEPAVTQFTAAHPDTIVHGWSELFSTMIDRSDEARGLKIGNFLRCFGPGKLLVFAGAALVELQFILGIMGGAKKIKESKGSARPRRR